MTDRRTDPTDLSHTPHLRAGRALRAGVAITAMTLLAITGLHAASANDGDTSRGRQPVGVDRALQRQVERARKDGEFISVSALRRSGDRLSAAWAGTADIETESKVPKGSHYRIGSVTKAFVATVLLQLEAEGKLSLDDSVEKWLPGLIAGNGYDANAITLRNLLQHTSGLPNHQGVKDFDMTASGFERELWNHYTAKELVAIALQHPPLFPPATKGDSNPNWEYSNTNYVVAGMVIEKATGRDWRDAVEDRIIEPLGLAHTYAPGRDPRVREPHARTYKRFSESRDTWTDTTVRNVTHLDAAGEMISTLSDLETFMTALLGGKLLPKQQLQEMQETVPVRGGVAQIMPEARYGLGLIRLPLPCGGHQWVMGGQVVGGDTVLGQTSDGSRSVVIAATGMAGSEQMFKGMKSLQRLMADSLCARAD